MCQVHWLATEVVYPGISKEVLTLCVPAPKHEFRGGISGKRTGHHLCVQDGGESPVAQTVQNSPANAGAPASVSGSGRPPGEGHGYPLQYPCLENSTDRGAWWATSMGSKRVGHD